MKALILAAGFGKRLLPYTQYTPKPLFTICGTPILHSIILKLVKTRCSEIVINTHHLNSKIDDFVAKQNYSIPVNTCYEPEILGTGGAIKNLSSVLSDGPFFVINSDVFTNVDFKQVYDFHVDSNCIATLVFYDCSQFNSVKISENGFVKAFYKMADLEKNDTPSNDNILTFTGIQVLNPEFVEFIPDIKFQSSIDIYKNILNAEKNIKAYTSKNFFWHDIGSPLRYKDIVFNEMTKKIFSSEKFEKTQLKGDGSNRVWFRVKSDKKSFIAVDHGIKKEHKIYEVDSFIAIGNFLYKNNVPVPKILSYDDFSGLVFLQDLGDTNLQEVVKNAKVTNKITQQYQEVMDELICMGINCKDGFEDNWAYQTPMYDKDLIINRECLYFFNEFLNGFMGLNLSYDDLVDEFELIASKTMEYAHFGFMHRDMQSRNIMIKDNKVYFIDFQAARIGPIQYDIASLILDPYVELSDDIKASLYEYYINQLYEKNQIDKSKFELGYNFCSLTRNMQILGAYSFLSQKQNKLYFIKYIKPALKTLKNTLNQMEDFNFTKLQKIIQPLKIEN